MVGGWICAKASNPKDPLLGSIIGLKYTYNTNNFLIIDF